MKLIKSLIIVLILYSTQTNSYAQSPVDSLKAVCTSNIPNTNKLKAYQELVLHLIEQDSTLTERYITAGTALARSVQNKPAELMLLLHQGKLYTHHKNHKRAIELYEKVLSQSKTAGYQRVNASVLFDLGTNYNYQGQYQKAIAYFEQSLALWKSLKDQKEIAVCFNNLGSNYLYIDNYPTAMAFLEKGLKLFESIGDQEGMMRSFNNIGLIHRALGNFKEAHAFFEKSLVIAERLGIKEKIASALNNVGIIYFEHGNYDEAIVYYEKSAAIRAEMGDLRGMGIALHNIGFMQQAQGKFDEAQVSFEKSLKYRKEADDIYGVNFSLLELGFIHLQQMNDDSAFYYFNQSFSICKEMGYAKILRSHFQDIGIWYESQGHLPKALNFYYNALKIAEEIKDTLGIGHVYNSIATIYQTQKNTKNALNYLQKSLNAYKIVQYASGIAKSRNTIGKLLYENNSYDEGLKYAFLALTDYQHLNDSCSFADCYLTIGNIYLGLEQIDSSLYYLRKSEKQAEKCEANITLAWTNISLGKIYQAKNASKEAFQAYKTAFFYAKKSQNREVLKEAAAYLYPLYEQKGQLAQALATFKVFQVNKDSLFNKDNTRKLAQKELAYTYEKEQREKDVIQQQELERQQWFIYTGIGSSLALLFISIAVYGNYRNKQRANELLKKQNEEIARQKAELEKLDHVKSRFFANISHELRTPLTLISSPVKRILQETQQALTPNHRHSLQLVERNTEQLKGLVNDILDLSKLESDKLTLIHEQISIKPLISRIASNFESLAHSQGIVYKIDISTISSMWVEIDTLKFEKVINNLLSNAIKYTPKTGEVTLRAKEENKHLHIQVADTGQGIAKDDLPHIFDRFYQSKQPDVPIQGGSGIGLALAKELAHFMGGSLTVKSELNKGSIFSFVVPYQKVAVSKASILEQQDQNDKEIEVSLEHLIIPTEPIETKKYHVLIVEDHPDMQQFIKGLLHLKYHIYLANNGKEALELLATQHIDLIISDVMMPEMDGHTLLQQLKQSGNYYNIPVIMLTALDSEDSRLQALTIGVDDYLTKPFVPQELLARAHNLLIRHEVRRKWEQSENILETVSVEKRHNSNDHGHVKGIEQEKKDIEWLKNVEQVIYKELENDNFQLTDLAERFHLSERQFRRRLKNATGLSPKKFQQEVALQTARQLFERGAFSTTKAVAYSVGINHVYRFTKLYEARFGKKPSDYFN